MEHAIADQTNAAGAEACHESSSYVSPMTESTASLTTVGALEPSGVIRIMRSLALIAANQTDGSVVT